MIRVKEADAERIRQLAETEDRPMTAIVSRALDAYAGPAAVSAPTPEPRPTGCSHPKAAREFKGYMTRCDPAKGGCGAKL